MTAYANLHVAFEQMRVRALRVLHGSPAHGDDPAANTDPPRVLVVGPENSGKTTVCKILINYAVRAGQGWSPLLANVDPSEASRDAPHIRYRNVFTVSFRVAGRLQVPCQLLLSILPSQHLHLRTPWDLLLHRLPLPLHLMLFYPSFTGMVTLKRSGILC